MLTAALMLDHLGLGEEARAVETAVADAIREGHVTPDLGGSLGTEAVGEWIRERAGRPMTA
jgi:isocitrate/isopropylmalate dehydrogenase